jgi:hypothetical protein
MSAERKHQRRLDRQFEAITRAAPGARGAVSTLTHNRMRLLRLPLAVFLILGSFLAILPVFGLWMLPLGLMLLALDVPLLRPRVSAAVIHGRRRTSLWRRRFLPRRGSRPDSGPPEA